MDDAPTLLPEELTIHVATAGELSIPGLYAILRLRSEVFVVEQMCWFNDLDGRDLERDTRHVWAEDARGDVAGYARVLAEPDGTHQLGRVVVDPRWRGHGVGPAVVRTALALIPGVAVLNAQAGLVPWYERFGFRISGPPYWEDNLPHLPMRREPPPQHRRPPTTEPVAHPG